MTQASQATGRALIICVVLIKLWIFALSAQRYGYLSDELYFLDASRHPAFGYVDFPPMIAWVMGLIRVLLGDSLWMIRLVATLIGTATALLCIDTCRLLGGGSVARWMTAAVALFAPGVLSVQSLMTMNVLDQLWWVLSIWFLVQYLTRETPIHLLGLGIVLGLGVQTKLSMVALILGILSAAIIWRRDLFRRREVWVSALMVLLLSLPFLVWQVVNQFPFLEFIAAYNAKEPLAIVLQNPALGLLLTMSPLYALVWFPGGAWGLITRQPAMRFVGTALWVSLAVFAVAGVKFYFAVPVLMIFSISGAIWWERWLGTEIGTRSAIPVSVLFVSGLLTVPMAAPVLSGPRLQMLIDYLQAGETGGEAAAPADLERYFPHFAEMHGWPELVDQTGSIVASLEDENLSLVAAHFGQAGAINQLDDDERLPSAFSGHMSYAFWNQAADLSRVLFIGFDGDELSEMYAKVEDRGQLSCVRCMNREKAARFYLASEPRLEEAEIRQRIKRYYFF